MDNEGEYYCVTAIGRDGEFLATDGRGCPRLHERYASAATFRRELRQHIEGKMRIVKVVVTIKDVQA